MRHIRLALLQQFVDGEVTPLQAQRVAAHVQNCPQCATKLQAAKAENDRVARLLGPSETDPSPDELCSFTQGVMARILSPQLQMASQSESSTEGGKAVALSDEKAQPCVRVEPASDRRPAPLSCDLTLGSGDADFLGREQTKSHQATAVSNLLRWLGGGNTGRYLLHGAWGPGKSILYHSLIVLLIDKDKADSLNVNRHLCWKDFRSKLEVNRSLFNRAWELRPYLEDLLNAPNPIEDEWTTAFFSHPRVVTEGKDYEFLNAYRVSLQCKSRWRDEGSGLQEHALPAWVSSINAADFTRVKCFLSYQRDIGRNLATDQQLYQAFQAEVSGQMPSYLSFASYVRLAELTGSVRHVGAKSLVLLQPEYLQRYEDALLGALTPERDGTGSISEVRVRTGDFAMPPNLRIPNAREERLFLGAAVDDFVRHDVARRVQIEGEPHLVMSLTTSA